MLAKCQSFRSILDVRSEESYWQRAGWRSEKEFVKNSTSVTVLISSKSTELQHHVPTKDNEGMQAKAPRKRLEPGLSFQEIATEVLAIFEQLG